MKSPEAVINVDHMTSAEAIWGGVGKNGEPLQVYASSFSPFISGVFYSLNRLASLDERGGMDPARQGAGLIPVIIVVLGLLVGTAVCMSENDETNGTSGSSQNKLVIPTATPDRNSFLYKITHPLGDLTEAAEDGYIDERECEESGRRWEYGCINERK